MEDWMVKATELFYKYRGEAEKYDAATDGIKALALISAGKAVALSELLEIFGHKPEI